jgi:hypothetical protein
LSRDPPHTAVDHHKQQYGAAVPDYGTTSKLDRFSRERDGQRERYAMARRYSRAAAKDVKSAMHRRKRGTLKRGKGGRGGSVKSRKQAIAIGLSEARKKGKKVPKQRSAKR